MRNSIGGWGGVATLLLGCAAGDGPAVCERCSAGATDAGGDKTAKTDSGSDEASGDCTRCSVDEICVERRCTQRGTLVNPTFAACSQPPCINVYNHCPVPIWIHAVATVAIDEGMVRMLVPGDKWQYAALPALGGGRLYAYYREPAVQHDATRLVSDFNQFVEMTIDKDAATGRWAQNYNISYVDYASLPVLMKASGSNCGETKCGARFPDWLLELKRCPTDLRNAYQDIATCTGSFNYCMTADGSATYDTSRTYCTKMQEAHGFSGSSIYGGYFPDHPATDVSFWDGVAAWNRGTLAGDANDDHYYVTPPYNDYARWIHQELGCSNVYAFSTDDHQDKAGFVRCVAPELNVVWCPYE